MNNILNRIIFLNIELEGALRVAANRPSPQAIDNAKKKFAEISALFAMLNPTDAMESQKAMQTQVKINEAESAELDPMPEPKLPTGPEAFKEIVATEEEKNPRVTTGQQFEIRREPADIRKMFTLNDKFLFKRELFGNNDEEFNATLDLISSMDSFDEAEEYIYEDLGWDSSNNRLRDFMAVISSFFNERG